MLRRGKIIICTNGGALSSPTPILDSRRVKNSRDNLFASQLCVAELNTRVVYVTHDTLCVSPITKSRLYSFIRKSVCRLW